jgi:amino acid transporter
MVATVVSLGVFWALNAWAFSISEPVSKIQELNAAGLTAATPVADHYWGWGRLFVILTALTAVTAVYVATIVGASRALYAMSRQGVLPRSLAVLQPRFGVPWRAMHVVYGIALAAGLTVVLVLDNALEGFIWWAGAVVLFALVTYIGVNLANIVYFTRFVRERFNVLWNGVVPAAGIALDGYVIYRSFYKSLWSAGFRTGRSVILVSSLLIALALVYVVFLAWLRPAAIRSRAFMADEEPIAP